MGWGDRKRQAGRAEGGIPHILQAGSQFLWGECLYLPFSLNGGQAGERDLSFSPLTS